MSKFDQIYRRMLLSKFFTKGWGKPEDLKKIFHFRKIISDRDKCKHLVPPDYPIHIDKEVTSGDYRYIDGHFLSPFTKHLPGVMPKEVEIARFQVVLPKQWKSRLKPVCIHLAGTGDHYFWRRRALLARPLLKEAGIASIILENPYYGTRKPKAQLHSSLHNVSDLFVMGGALIVESLALLHWCEREGFGPLGLTGISMGGHMASLASTNWDKPHVLVPCLSWSTASQVFTKGVLSESIPWRLLEEQYLTDSIYQDQIKKLIVSPEEIYNNAAFQLGREFVQSFPESDLELDKYKDFYAPNENGNENLNVITEKMHNDVKNNNTATYETRSEMEDPHWSLRHLMNKAGSNVINFHSLPLPAEPKISVQYPAAGIKTSASRNANVQSKVRNKNSKYHTSEQHRRNLKKEALNFMRGVMDECTHLGNFSVPIDTSLVIIVAAKQDAYIPRDNVLSLKKLWPGSEVRYIDSGHIGAFLFNQDHFRKAIIDAFDRQIRKYYS